MEVKPMTFLHQLGALAMNYVYWEIHAELGHAVS